MPVFTEGTFAEQSALANIEHEDNKYDDDNNAERQPKHSLGCVSFGAANNRVFLGDSFSEKSRKDDGVSNASIISIKDIKEVRDRVPASPATAVKQPQQDYFQ